MSDMVSETLSMRNYYALPIKDTLTVICYTKRVLTVSLRNNKIRLLLVSLRDYNCQN